MRAVSDHELGPRQEAIGTFHDARPRRDLMRADFSWSDPPPRVRHAEEASFGPSGSVRVPVPVPAPAPEATEDLLDTLMAAPPAADELSVELDAGVRPTRAPSTGAVRSRDHAPSGTSTTGSRRTIVITGHGAERNLPVGRGYDAGLRLYERSGFKPDRMALWAVLLGLAMLLAAATSSHAAVLHAVAAHVR